MYKFPYKRLSGTMRNISNGVIPTPSQISAIIIFYSLLPLLDLLPLEPSVDNIKKTKHP